MHVILAGAGVGGLTAALALSRRSIATTVVEQSETLGEVGAGVQLSPNATRILFDLGLEAPLRAIAFAPQAAEVRDRRSGRLLLRTELGEAAVERWGAPYLQVHRADLQAVLIAAARDRGDVRIVLGARLTALTQDQDCARARLAGAERDSEADALIGCDGIRSTVRAALWGERPARYTGQTAWRGLVDARRLAAVHVPPVAMVWTGTGRHFVHYPVRGGALVNVVGVVGRHGAAPESWSEPGDRTAFARDFAGWPEPVGALIAATDTVWRYAIHDRQPLAAWSSGRVSLLGDAAHPAPPFLAQGAGMAIEDAEALARRLAAASSVSLALKAYEAERRGRTIRVQAWSRRNSWLFHLPAAPASGLFATAALLQRLRPASGPLDWLYGYVPPGSHNGEIESGYRAAATP